MVENLIIHVTVPMTFCFEFTQVEVTIQHFALSYSDGICITKQRTARDGPRGRGVETEETTYRGRPLLATSARNAWLG